MAIAKILGIETEYGVTGGPSPDPIVSSGLLVHEYASHSARNVNWDSGLDHPWAEGFSAPLLTSFAPVVETLNTNSVLANGARFYVDHAHPEYSSPECRTPREGLLYDLAGEEILRQAMTAANLLSPESPIVVYKNNSDGKGNSYGCHENYLVDRSLAFNVLVDAMITHFVSRQIITGTGKIGSETLAMGKRNPLFQISQRSEFFEEITGIETMLRRPIVNTRDEPHGDATRFRRLHIINGDANQSQVSTLVKLGATSLLLAIVEDWGIEVFPAAPTNPVEAIHFFSSDLTLRGRVDCRDGARRSAWDFQNELWILARRYVDHEGGGATAPPDEVEEILVAWRTVLDDLLDQPERAADRVEWIAKRLLLQRYQDKFSLADGDARLRAIDLQFHDLRPQKSLAQRLGFQEIFALPDVNRAVTEPPSNTRAYFRGKCVTHYSDRIALVNWDLVIFDLGGGHFARIPMADPTRGTEALTSDLFTATSNLNGLIDQLGV